MTWDPLFKCSIFHKLIFYACLKSNMTWDPLFNCSVCSLRFILYARLKRNSHDLRSTLQVQYLFLKIYSICKRVNATLLGIHSLSAVSVGAGMHLVDNFTDFCFFVLVASMDSRIRNLQYTCFLENLASTFHETFIYLLLTEMLQTQYYIYTVERMIFFFGGGGG